MILAEETRVEAPPEDVFAFFERMEEHYTAWHPDHISFRWLEEGGLEAGNRAYFEEVIGGERKQQTVRFRTVEAGRYIEFHPTSRLIRLLLPRISFSIEPEGS